MLKVLSLNTTQELDMYVRLLVKGIQEAIEDSTPLARLSLCDKTFWT